MRFEYPLIIRLHDTDAAGLLFFGHLFRHAQDACESFMETLGFPLDRIVREGRILLPLTHAEADYRQPLRHGDRVGVRLSVLEVRARSFSLGYAFTLDDGRVAASARTVHVQLPVAPDAPATLDPELRAALLAWLGDAPSLV